MTYLEHVTKEARKEMDRLNEQFAYAIRMEEIAKMEGQEYMQSLWASDMKSIAQKMVEVNETINKLEA